MAWDPMQALEGIFARASERAKTMNSYFVGVDLGQTTDYTAIAVLHGITDINPPLMDCVHLERLPLDTPYPEIIDHVAALVARPELSGCVLAVDQTGVGRPVVDSFRAAGLPCAIKAVTITAGAQVTADGSDYRVPKRDLAGLLQMLLGNKLLRFAAGMELTPILVRELATFSVKITASGNETFEAWREKDHDDLVLAVAIAAWVARRSPMLDASSVGMGDRVPASVVPRGVGLGGSFRHWPRGV